MGWSFDEMTVYEFAVWSNARHNLDERLARAVVKYFAVHSTVTCAESLCTVVYTVRGSREYCEEKAVASHDKFYAVQCAHLHKICSNQSCEPAFII